MFNCKRKQEKRQQMVGTKGEVGYAAPSGSSNLFVFSVVRVRIKGSMQTYQPDRYYQMLSICNLNKLIQK